VRSWRLDLRAWGIQRARLILILHNDNIKTRRNQSSTVKSVPIRTSVMSKKLFIFVLIVGSQVSNLAAKADCFEGQTGYTVNQITSVPDFKNCTLEELTAFENIISNYLITLHKESRRVEDQNPNADGVILDLINIAEETIPRIRTAIRIKKTEETEATTEYTCFVQHPIACPGGGVARQKFLACLPNDENERNSKNEVSCFDHTLKCDDNQEQALVWSCPDLPQKKN